MPPDASVITVTSQPSPAAWIDRHRDADLGPQAGDDQLLAAGRLDDVHHILVLPGVDPGPIDDFLVREIRR